MQILNDLHQIGSHFWIETLRHNFSSCASLHCGWLLMFSSWVVVSLGKESRRPVLFLCRVELWMLCLLGEIAGARVLPGLFTQVLDGLSLSFQVQLQFGEVQCNLIFLCRFYNLHIVIIGPWLFVDSWQVIMASCVCWKLLLARLGFFLGWIVDWVCCCESVGTRWIGIIGSIITAFVVFFLRLLILMWSFLLAELAVQVSIECPLFRQSASCTKIVRQFVIGCTIQKLLSFLSWRFERIDYLFILF